jgi:hypothetical protein
MGSKKSKDMPDVPFDIEGRDWVIKYTKENLGVDQLGICYFTGCRIIIEPNLKGLEMVDTVIHEILHAALPDISEEAVCRAADAVTLGLAGSEMIAKRWATGTTVVKDLKVVG